MRFELLIFLLNSALGTGTASMSVRLDAQLEAQATCLQPASGAGRMCLASRVVDSSGSQLATNFYQFSTADSPQQVLPPPFDELGTLPPGPETAASDSKSNLVHPGQPNAVVRIILKFSGGSFVRGGMELRSNAMMPKIQREDMPVGHPLLERKGPTGGWVVEKHRWADKHNPSCFTASI